MTKETLQNIFRSPFTMPVWQDMLINLFGATEILNTPSPIDCNHKNVVKGAFIGELNTTDRYAIGLFSFEVNENTKIGINRVGLRKLVHSYTIYEYDAAIAVFYNDQQWRLSFISDLKGENTAPKRFTYVFGNADETYRTATERLMRFDKSNPTFQAIKEAFSVEKLSHEFFEEYKKQYAKFLAKLDDNKGNRDYVKKMLGRLVFLQFLQKKGWMGVPATNNGWHGGDVQYIQNLVKKHNGNEKLLTDVLEKLFFDTLNVKRENDLVDADLGDNIRIPYLNGGLFDKDKIDEKDIDFPYEYFTSLMEFFSNFNFTIDENDPYDAEVGIDPEMLGHIFENLLEDNKDKGAFYTPKEIVQYMCKQSLIEYLQSKMGAYPEIATFINSHLVGDPMDKSNFIGQNARTIEQLLNEVKICDPAIGSGAFPMGILNEIFHAKMALNLTHDRATVKKNIIQNTIYGVDIEQGAVDIARLRFWLSLVVEEDVPQPLPNLDYKIVCGNSLLNRYALHEPIDKVLKEYNRGKKIEDRFTLANYKDLVAEYTNTSNKEQKDNFRDKIAEIKSAFKTHLDDKTLIARKKLEAQIDDLKSDNLFGSPSKADLKLAKEKEKKLKVMLQNEADVTSNQLYENAFEWRFEFPALLDDEGKFMGFDIVVGNPPYLRIQGIRDVDAKLADEYVKQFDSATGSFDLYVLFVEQGLRIITPDGVVNYIMPIKWTNAAFGKGLRKIIAENNSANKIISFGAYQVFNASTYTGLQWFKHNSKDLQYCELDKNLYTNEELGEYLSSLNKDCYANIFSEKLDEKAWVLTVGETTKILNRLEQHPRRISDIFEKIFQGLATSKDDVYFLYECEDYEATIRGYSKYIGDYVEIEQGLVKPLLKGEDVHRYDNILTDRYVIFPYKLEDGKAHLYSEKELAELFPKGYEYLKRCEGVLRGREKGRFNIDGEWFQFGRKQGILFAEYEKLVAPDISMGGNFAYDVQGEFYSTTTIYGYIKRKEVADSYKVLMAILNSRLCWWFLTQTGTTLANGFFRFKPDYINPFPVPAQIPAETEKAITILVDYILHIKCLNNNEQIDEYVDNNLIIKLFENIIDALVYELYFSTEFEDADIAFAKYIVRDFCDNEPISMTKILRSYQTIRVVDNEVRNNIKYMAIKMNGLLSPFIDIKL